MERQHRLSSFYKNCVLLPSLFKVHVFLIYSQSIVLLLQRVSSHYVVTKKL